VVVISDTCRCRTCFKEDDVDDVDDDDSIIRELEDDNDVFFFDDAIWLPAVVAIAVVDPIDPTLFFF